MTFFDAAAELIEWIKSKAGSDLSPTLVLPKSRSEGLLLAPWRLDTPRAERVGRAARHVATGRFALGSTDDDPAGFCDIWDKLFFAAIDDPVWRMSETDPPADFWPVQMPHTMTFACDIFRGADGVTGGIVQKPLVVDISLKRAGDGADAFSKHNRGVT